MVDGRLVLHGKRGISELVAAMLLILITIAGGIIVYVYSSGMLGSLQGAQPQQQYVNKISLEYYNWTSKVSPTLQIVKIILRNVGSGRGTLAAFYVGNSTASIAVNLNSTLGSTCTTANPLNPQVSCLAVLSIPISFKVTPNTAYTVKVVTKDGAIFPFSCIAGQSTSSFS